MKAFSLFDDRDTALHAKETWFPGEERHLLAVRVLLASQIHKGDSKWLDSYEHEWEAKARKYWAGELTDDPMPEAILHGGPKGMASPSTKHWKRAGNRALITPWPTGS